MKKNRAHLTEQQKQKLKRSLLDEEKKIVTQLKTFTIYDKSDPGGFRTKISDEEDSGRSDEDNIQDRVVYTNKSAAEDVLEGRLKEIRNALDRIDRDEYGLCEECGKLILARRLEYNPAARLCIKCGSTV